MQAASEGGQRLPTFPHLFSADLKLDGSQWEERSAEDSYYLEADALVHDDWLTAVGAGHVTGPQLPPIPQEEIHWLLQPSCESVLPQPWQRVHVICVRKPQQAVTSSRTLVPQLNNFSTESVHDFLTQVAQENRLLSWKEVMYLLHQEPAQLSSRAHVTSSFIHELVQKLYNTQVHFISPQDSYKDAPPPHRRETTPTKSYPDSGGGSAPEKTKPPTEGHKRNKHESVSSPEGPKDVHPNLSPLLAALESAHAYYFLFPYLRFTLFDAIMHSPAMLEDSVAKPLFVLYQLLNLLNHCHGKGATLGALGLKNVFIDARLWVQIRLPSDVFSKPPGAGEVDVRASGGGVQSAGRRSEVVDPPAPSSLDEGGVDDHVTPSPTPVGSLHPSHAGSTNTLTGIADDPSPLPTTTTSPHHPSPLHLCEAVQKWRTGELSNFDYLMLLNQHAGRVIGDPNNHPIFPWVIEFTHRDGGFRDLTKSKYRLNKGDRQLDFTFMSAQEELRRGSDHEALVPHHIGDISSDVTYYVYLARKTPKEVLCSRVRPQWVPKEYPSSLEKMYIWTPDECIPEFFADPSIFESIHPDLPDLAIPDWASSPDELISIHRAILEGDVVSANLHHWIDLMFGYKLSGHDAIRAKNIYASLVDKHKDPKNCGVVQLFRSSHPKRIQTSSAPLAILSWNTYLSMSSMMNASSFTINQPGVAQALARGNLPSGGRFAAPRHFHSPEPDDKRTLESIIIEAVSQSQNGAQQSEEGGLGEGGQESMEEDFTGSFEHVNMDDVKDKRNAVNPSPALPSNTEIGINYEEAPTVPAASGEPSKPHPPTHTPAKNRESVVMPLPGSNRFRVPVVNMIFNRQRNKVAATENESGYYWQQEVVSFPKEANILHKLNKLEEMCQFTFKCCKDDGGLYKEQWKVEDLLMFENSQTDTQHHPVLTALRRLRQNPDYYPTFDERVALDLAAITCTVIELCCVKQLRAATPTNPTLVQRIATIRKLMKTGQLRLPSYLCYLTEFILCPEQPGHVPPSPGELKLPSLTSSILLQPFLPVVMFPGYFKTLYQFLYRLEQLCHRSGMDYATMDLQRLTFMGLQLKKLAKERNCEEIFAYVSERLEGLLETVTDEGFPLLLLHLFPFFQYPDTSFDAVYTFLPPLARHMSKRSVEKVFTAIVTRLFDTATEPHQRGQLYSRTTADLILRRFGLNTFLTRFLGFLIEAVVEPLRAPSKGHSGKRINTNIVRMKSQSVLTLMSSDLLQSQVYGNHSGETDAHVDVNLSYSLAMNEPSYDDSDKEYSSSNESDDDNNVAEMSLLAKSSMLSVGTDGEMEGASQSPLILTSQQHQSSTPGVGGVAGVVMDTSTTTDGSPQLGGGRRSRGNSEREVVVPSSESGLVVRVDPAKEDTGSHYSLIGSVPPQLGGDQPRPLTLNEQQGGLTSSYQDSLVASSQFDPTLSMASQFSEESFASNVHFTSSLQPATSSGHREGPFSKQHSLPIGMKLGGLLPGQFGRDFESMREEGEREGEEGEEEEGDADTVDGENLHSHDPQALAVNLNISEVAADCLSWLLRRLGPLLGCQHIVRPLMENLHRCFLGILQLNGREVAALKCLASFTECYGEVVVRKMYVPHAENLVSAAINRMTVKSEAGVAASLGLISVSIKSLSPQSLIDSTQEICDRYFLPLIQLLSSQTTFPGGGKARAAICESMVKLLISLGEQLGREQACNLLGSTLQCFFASFSGVHQEERRASSSSNVTGAPNGHIEPELASTPVSSSLKHTGGGSTSRPEAKTVEFHPLTEPVEKEGSNLLDSEAYQQLCATFSKPMAHSAYVIFCKLLGQIYLQDCLYNSELIEQLAYTHDKVAHDQPNSPLSSILTDRTFPDSDANSDSSSDSDEDAGVAMEAVLKVGPIAAVTGLNMEEAGFRKSSWFVDLEEGEKEEGVSSKEGPPSPQKTVSKASSIEKNVATFDAKFSGMVQQEGSVAQLGGRGLTPGATPSTQVAPQQDYTLMGAWEELWESQLHEPAYRRDGLHHFRGGKLQTYTGTSGHKGTVKCLACSDGEHYFVSGSKDKTVKVWSLRNQGKGSASVGSQLTYSGHQRPVAAVELLERTDTVASCDGTVQLWDTETGYLLHQFTSPRPSHSYVTMKVLPSSQAVLVAATSDLYLRFMDARVKTFQHLWKLQFPTGGIIRALACADNWISIGNHNGTINTLDVRTGELLSLWKPADSASVQTTTWNESLVQMKATARGSLVTSVGNGLLSLWRPTHGKLVYHLKGQSSTTNCLEVVGDQLISASQNGNVVIHSAFESPHESHHVSLRPSRKTVSSLAVLQENRMLLVGHDNGQIVLMA